MPHNEVIAGRPGQWFAAEVTDLSRVPIVPVSLSHPPSVKGRFLLELFLDEATNLADSLKAVFSRLGPAVEAVVIAIEVALPVRPQRDEIVAIRFVHLEPLGVGSLAVALTLLGALRLVFVGHSYERALKVQIYYEGRAQCILKLAELEDVIVILSARHRNPLDTATVDTSALRSMLLETLGSSHTREGVETARAVGFLVAGVTSQQRRQAGHRDVVVTGVRFVGASLSIKQQDERDPLTRVIIAHVERLEPVAALA